MKAQILFSAGLACAVIVGAAATLWLRGAPGQSAVEPAARQGSGPQPLRRGTGHEALSGEIDRLKAERDALERRSGEVQSELDSLRSGLTQVNRNQAAIGQEVNRLGGAARTEGGEPAAALTPEQARERADARVQSQLETLEGTMRTQPNDPSAQVSLQQAFQRAGIAGLQLENAQCGADLCRMEIASDGSVPSEDSFRALTRVAPWPGQGFARIDSESGNIVVYLATQGHALPGQEGARSAPR